VEGRINRLVAYYLAINSRNKSAKKCNKIEIVHWANKQNVKSFRPLSKKGILFPPPLFKRVNLAQMAKWGGRNHFAKRKEEGNEAQMPPFEKCPGTLAEGMGRQPPRRLTKNRCPFWGRMADE
jgi:hypothetical protein